MKGYFVEKDLLAILKKYRPYLKPVILLNDGQKMTTLDLSSANNELDAGTMTNVDKLSNYINTKIAIANATFGMGGYLEDRKLYQHSRLFDGTQIQSEPRTIHLGVDIWGPAGTSIHTPLGGTVHSFAFNNNKGDYGATIILQHQLNGYVFHTLYGHLALADLKDLRPNNFISSGICIGHFGSMIENGNWPPHLHFQLIIDMQMKIGDYPGVCAPSQKDYYRLNCPDANQILSL